MTRHHPLPRLTRQTRRLPALAAVVAWATLAPAAPPATAAAGGGESPAAAILDGVAEIAAPGVPGSLTTFSDHAWPVVCGKEDRDLLAPVVVAAEIGPGRIVAFGHSGYGDAATLRTADTGRLALNALRWAGRAPAPAEAAAPDAAKTRVGVLGGDVAGWLDQQGFAALPLAKGWDQAPPAVSVIWVNTSSPSDGELKALAEFLDRGGGLIAAQTGWGWKQLSGDRPMRENRLNQFLARAGLAWTDETLDRTSPAGFDVKGPPGPMLRGVDALERMLAPALPTPPAAPRPLVADDDLAMRQASSTAMRAVRALPPDEQRWRGRLAAATEGAAGALSVSKARPLSAKRDPQARFLLASQLWDLDQRSPEQVRAIPASESFPGPVLPSAQRVTRTIKIDTAIPGRHSLGLYAPAGEVITIRSPLVKATPRTPKLAARIGAHSDELWGLERWERAPAVCTTAPLAAEVTRLASPFGGLFYIEAPDRCELGVVSVTVEGCVEAPLFVLGETDAAAWRERIRTLPGPWAEFATRKVIVTVPSAAVRSIDDPAVVLKLWDRVLDAAADLATIPRDRPRPERYVADLQISAGYMHSGYPIMTHLDAADSMVQAERLAAGTWGLFHELGHNHQVRDWTFDGTGEVTCNLFSLYIMETVCGVPDERAHDALKDPEKYVGPHLAKGAPFKDWKNNPFLALRMYIQLRDAFGWDTYKRVFSEYRALKPAERPRGDDQERDQWMVRFSRAAGRNLGPFFQAWGVPTSEEARRSIADLPVWMPEGLGR